MVVVALVALLAALALPSYQEYVRRSTASQAQQAMQQLAVELDRYKARNFNYKGFATTSMTVAADRSYPYTLNIVDGTTGNPLLTSDAAVGRTWAIQATTADVKNYNFLLTSSGTRCKQKTTLSSYSSCGTASESW
jgi:type IV pilus assembly protein PilE